MSNISQLLAKITIPVFNIDLDFPAPAGIFSRGVFSAIGYFLSFFFGILLLIWVVYSVYAAYVIITSQMGEKLEKGVTLIKNIWMTISIGIAFFLVLSALGSFLGFGSIFDWSKNAAQCGDYTGGFYFLEYQAQKTIYESEGITYSDQVYCCKVLQSLDNSGVTGYEKTAYLEGYHWIVSINGASPDSAASGYFGECTAF